MKTKAYKADIVKEGVYGAIFIDGEVKKLYLAFHNQYIFNAVKKWVLHGIWNEEQIGFEIETIKEREKAETSQFSGYFNEMWQSNIASQDINIEESIIGFQSLLIVLTNQSEELRKTNKSFAIHHTDAFIKVMKDLIEKAKNSHETDS